MLRDVRLGSNERALCIAFRWRSNPVHAVLINVISRKRRDHLSFSLIFSLFTSRIASRFYNMLRQTILVSTTSRTEVGGSIHSSVVNGGQDAQRMYEKKARNNTRKTRVVIQGRVAYIQRSACQ